MRIQELFYNENRLDANQIEIIRRTCDQYISSTVEPLLKTIKEKEDNFIRMKVRFHKRQSDFIGVFNEALSQKFNIPNLHQRSIFANGNKTFIGDRTESYYVFPINGFKFMYNPQIVSSNAEYRSMFDRLLEDMNGDDNKVSSIMKDLISDNYIGENLENGIVEGCEIILYNIPYYYAVKVEAFPDYSELLNILER